MSFPFSIPRYSTPGFQVMERARSGVNEDKDDDEYEGVCDQVHDGATVMIDGAKGGDACHVIPTTSKREKICGY